jgi:hypothetical protein
MRNAVFFRHRDYEGVRKAVEFYSLPAWGNDRSRSEQNHEGGEIPNQVIVCILTARQPTANLPKIKGRHQQRRFFHAPVAQLDSASVFGTEGCRFESCRVYLTYVNSASEL